MTHRRRLASMLLRAARNASAASRAARLVAAAAPAGSLAARSAAAASRGARSVAAASSFAAGYLRTKRRLALSSKRRDDVPSLPSYLLEPGKSVTDKDLESDEAIWALYECWCKAFNKERDHAEMVRRFNIFKVAAHCVDNWNRNFPERTKLGQVARLSKSADGGDPDIHEDLLDLLETNETREIYPNQNQSP